MDIRLNKLEQLQELAKLLHEVAAPESLSPVDWTERRLTVEESAIFLETFIIPKITVEPRYVSGNGGVKMAEYVPAPDRDPREVTLDDSSAGVPFLANGGKP